MTVLTLQPDETSGTDTMLSDANTGNNFGISLYMRSGNDGATFGFCKGLIKFDISSLPASASITNATLTLVCYSVSSNTAYGNAIHRSLVQWYEGNKANAAPSGGIDGSTWNHKNAIGSVAWGAAGGLAGTDYASGMTVDCSVSTTGTYTWDVTADVQDFYDGTYTNHGWWLIGQSASDAQKSWRVSGSSASDRPKLAITYTIPEISGSAAGVATVTGTLVSNTVSGSAAGVGSVTGTMSRGAISGTIAGAATATGALDADGFLHGASAGVGAVTGTLAIQNMAGAAAGLALVSGEALALLTYQQPIWKAFVDGTEYALSGGDPFWRIQVTGIGLPPVRNIKQRGPSQHGSTRRTFRYDERILSLAYIFDASNPTTADLWRDRIAAIFAPLDDDEMIVEVTRTDGTQRRIRASLAGTLDMPDTPMVDRIGFSQRFVVQLECADPIWYDPELKNLVFTATAGGTAGWQIPMLVPFVQQSGDAIDQTETVHYTGSHKTFPQIVVTGPAQGLEITNQETGLKIKLKDDVVIAADDVWTFDLQYGAKTVKDIDGVLHNGDLHSSSSIGQWALEPNPKAPGGINNIRVQIPSAATANTRLQMVYYDRFAHL